MDELAVRFVAERFVTFLEQGTPPADLFAEDVFCDFTMPLWRLQAHGLDAVVELRRRSHPWPGEVARSRCDVTPTGFVIELEERWDGDGQRWYCREMARADLAGGLISELSVYCTGDWDDALQTRHAAEVALLRP